MQEHTGCRAGRESDMGPGRCKGNGKENEMVEELELRVSLSMERLSQIGDELTEEKAYSEEYRKYFTENADKLCKLLELGRQNKSCYECKAEKIKKKSSEIPREPSFGKLRALNRSLYEPYLSSYYGSNFANPTYAVKCFGEAYGPLYCFLAMEIYSVIPDAFLGDLEELVIRAELFLEIYGLWTERLMEEKRLPKPEEIKDILYWFVSDYSDLENEKRVRAMVDPDSPESSFFYDLIMNSNLNDLRYLMRYGCYITMNELQTAKHLNELPQKTIKLIADTFTEGYRIGFEVGNKDLSKKKTVNIRYCAGFERIIRQAILNFEEMGLRPVIYRASDSIFHKKGNMKIGFYGAVANKQLDYDHREDEALFFDGNYKTRKLETLQEAYEKVKDLAKVHAGPACMEVFGEDPFEPKNRPAALRLSESMQKRKVEYQQEAGEMVNRYIPGDERSFTIIAFPVPEIGDDYEEIFDEIVKINTLDYRMYADIQEKLIQTLDQAKYVHIRGMGANHTDLTVQLVELEDLEKQTKFENCVADVNIPVGEVFTSPVLQGTNGVLHVSHVYLNELYYEDLEIRFENGMTKEVSCGNFEDQETGCRYVKENVLFHHDSLPMGEFAIGTNTTAYVAAGKYKIADRLPILIAEKMGPHFAVGDTCYSHSEEVRVYNPDGKEIVAKDNAVSILRKSNPSKAYFNCHTDITIPYDELGIVEAVKEDGNTIPVIRNGRFVLPGCEKLNEAFEK